MRKLISTLLIVALGFAAIATPAFASVKRTSFSDVPSSHWAYGSIQTMAEMGIVGGVGGGKFDPNGKVSTAQFAAMVVRAFYNDEQEGRTSNVNKWWAVSMSIAQDRDLVRKTTAGKTYRTDINGAESWDIAAVEAPMTRADMAIVLTCTMDSQGMAEPSAAELEATRAKIADYSSIADNYKEAVTIAYNRGLLKGVDSKGSFNPNGQLTRAEACAVLERMLQQMGMIEGKPADTTTPSTPVDTTPTTPGTPADNTNSSGYKEGYLSNGQPITEANIKAMLDELKEQYPDGMEWSEDPKFDHYSPKFGNGGCLSFAAIMSDTIFGEDAPLTKHSNLANVKIGDVIWKKNSNTGYEHVVVVVGVTDKVIYTCSGNMGDMVAWDVTERRIDLAEIPELTIYTRY